METLEIYKEKLIEKIMKFHNISARVDVFLRLFYYEKGIDELAKLMFGKLEIEDYDKFIHILKNVRKIDFKFGGNI